MPKEENDFPIAYKRGWVYFLNSKIYLQPGVFIPREETRFWVRKTIEKLKKEGFEEKKFFALDLFSGSGCIGIAFLRSFPYAFVTFSDISLISVMEIKDNLERNKIKKERYEVLQGSIFEGVKRKYDFIFANPPYVATERKNEVQKSVFKYEPPISFLGGEKGLLVIKKFLERARDYLKEKGRIYMEFDPLQLKEIEKIIKRSNFSDFSFKKDQFGKFRWAEIFY